MFCEVAKIGTDKEHYQYLYDTFIPAVGIIPANTSISAFENFSLPKVIENAGGRDSKRFVEFFAAEIRNDYTRKAYGRVVGRFLTWCDDRGLVLEVIEPVHVAAYFKIMQSAYSAPTVKQHLAAVRMMCDYLVRGGVLQYSPAAAVRGPRYAVKKGKTPVLTAGEARELLDSIDSKPRSGASEAGKPALLTDLGPLASNW